MPADSALRTDVLEEVARLLRATLVSEYVDAVYDYELLGLDDTTAIEVIDAGTKSQPLGISDARWDNWFAFEINAYVKVANTHSDEQGGSNWTSKDVGNRLALIDKKIRDVIADNRSNPGKWTYFTLADDFSVIVEGRQKIFERDTELTNYKIESRVALVRYVEG